MMTKEMAGERPLDAYMAPVGEWHQALNKNGEAACPQNQAPHDAVHLPVLEA